MDVDVDVDVALARRVPRGQSALSDQLRGAAMSVPLKIAEGSAKQTSADRASFFRIARGSAVACGAALDVIALIHRPAAPDIAEAKLLVERIVAMLTKLGTH